MSTNHTETDDDSFQDSSDDDPFQDSSDEWSVETHQRGKKKGPLPRQSARIKTKQSKREKDSDESDDEVPAKKAKKNGVRKSKTPLKAPKKTPVKKEKNISSPAPGQIQMNQQRVNHRKFIPKTIPGQSFATGTFVINKKDAMKGDCKVHPCIWRIDGKNLLQKFEPDEQDGVVRHKCTSVYTGWSQMDEDTYAPISVDVIKHTNLILTVELHWDELKKIKYDSD